MCSLIVRLSNNSRHGLIQQPFFECNSSVSQGLLNGNTLNKSWYVASINENCENNFNFIQRGRKRQRIGCFRRFSVLTDLTQTQKRQNSGLGRKKKKKRTVAPKKPLKLMSLTAYNDAINSHLSEQRNNALCQLIKWQKFNISQFYIQWRLISLLLINHRSFVLWGCRENICEIISTDRASLCYCGYVPNSMYHVLKTH